MKLYLTEKEMSLLLKTRSELFKYYPWKEHPHIKKAVKHLTDVFRGIWDSHLG